MDWRQKLADYGRAQTAYERAERLVAELLARQDAVCLTDGHAPDPLVIGVELARRRAAREARNLHQATLQLTQGTSLAEALWSAPDDI